MRIVCPSCAAEYEVPASRLMVPRMVRCARCHNQWMADPNATADVPPDSQTAGSQTADSQAPGARPTIPSPAGIPAITAMDRLSAPMPRQPMSRALIAAWLLTFVVLGSAVAAAVTWREAVVQAWPASGRILGTGGRVAASMSHPPGDPAAASRPRNE